MEIIIDDPMDPMDNPERVISSAEKTYREKHPLPPPPIPPPPPKGRYRNPEIPDTECKFCHHKWRRRMLVVQMCAKCKRRNFEMKL